MIIITNIITGIFDIISIKLFYDSVFRKLKPQISNNFFYCLLLLKQTISTIYMFASSGYTSITKILSSFLVSFILYYMISLCYEVPLLRYRFFAAFFFYTLGAIAELLSALVFFTINPQIKTISNTYIDTMISFVSCIIWFLLVIIIATYKRNQVRTVPVKYTLLLFLTPASTIMIMICIPPSMLTTEGVFASFFPFLACLLVINILNYYLLDSVLDNHEKDKKIKTIERQLNEQEEKYDQLSEAYKQTRRIIHDVKQHNNYVIGCLEKGQYKDLADTLRTNIKEIEDKYIFSNTGNLVIDTFVNNFAATCKKYDIDFNVELTVDCDRVPIPDYDLCIIIGNLFDNCLNANNSLPDNIKKYMNVKIATTKKFLAIQIKNPIIPDGYRSEKDKLYHGYGLENVRLLCEKYCGLYNCQHNEDYCSTVAIPIPRTESELRLQRETEPGLKYNIKMLKDD